MKTLRVRIKDKHAKALDVMACECNMVWNYVNNLAYTHTQRTGKFFSAYDMAKYTAGATKEGMKILAQTVQGVTEEVRRIIDIAICDAFSPAFTNARLINFIINLASNTNPTSFALKFRRQASRATNVQ